MVRGYTLVAILIALIGVVVQAFPSAATVDLFYHDTYYVLAPLHVALAGTLLFGVFAGVSFLFEKLSGRKLSVALGHVHLGVTAVAFAVISLAGWLIGEHSTIPHPDGELGRVWVALSVAFYAIFPAQVLFPINLAWSWWRAGKARPA